MNQWTIINTPDLIIGFIWDGSMLPADPMAELASSLAAPPAPRYACERMPPAPPATFRKGSTTVVKIWEKHRENYGEHSENVFTQMQW